MLNVIITLKVGHCPILKAEISNSLGDTFNPIIPVTTTVFVTTISTLTLFAGGVTLKVYDKNLSVHIV
jgi:hypothetical protein